MAEEKPVEPKSTLERLAGASIFLVTASWVGGYCFWIGFYSQFSIDPLALEQPFPVMPKGLFEAILILFNQLNRKFFSVLLIVVVIFGIAATWRFYGCKWLSDWVNSQKWSWAYKPAKFLVGLLIALVALVVIPFSVGVNASPDQFVKHPIQVLLYFKPGDSTFIPQAVRQANLAHQLRLVVQTKDLVVVYVTSGNDKPVTRDKAVYVINRGNLGSVCVASMFPESPAPDNTCDSAELPHVQ